MRINRVETKAYTISEGAEEAALRHFKERASQMETDSKGTVSQELTYHYSPIAVLSAVKYDKDGKGIVISGMENSFHVGLHDAYFYIFKENNVRESVKETIIPSSDVQIERLDLLLKISTLSPKALQTMGYLLDNGTTFFDKLDMPTQTAAKELSGRKYAEIYRSVDKEGDFMAVFREIVEFQPVTPLWKVKPMLPAPRFMSTRYNLSMMLRSGDVVEDEVELEKIGHAPEKIGYILSTLFNCQLKLDRIVYLPYISCTFSWQGKQAIETRYIPCFKNANAKKYLKPKKLRTIMLGTKGHGLESIPFEDVTINFSNVAGMEDVKKRLREGIIYPIAHPELSKEFGTKGGGGVLLYGPPGCGKTYIMRAAVGEAGVNFYTVEIPDIIGDDPEASSKKLDEAFNEARQGAPSIVFFDEIEALGGARKAGQRGSEHRMVNQFLTDMEGVVASNVNVLIVGSTNAPWDMDAALRRSGRFTNQIFIPPPDMESRTQLFKLHVKGRPISPDVDLGKLAELTENYSSADITAICEEAAKIPWSESVHGGAKRDISMADFHSILDQRESTIIPWLRVAEKQLRDSGESDLFPELADYVFKRAGGIEMVSQPKLKFKDVGGLDDVKEEIKNKIVYPLKNPEAAKQYGRKLGGGMLLYGPPGCGKTYIAKATAGECEASFFNVKITDLLSPEEGVTEKRLHSIFERAGRNTPAVIFFDEIDAVAGRRSSAEGGPERRLINQFLTEM
ncbi:MAG: AAA family ATPase, partial [Candidatus Altiarchaeota archaeon]